MSKLWGLRYHRDKGGELWWEPPPGSTIQFLAFAASEAGAFVIVKCDEKPHPDADLLFNLDYTL